MGGAIIQTRRFRSGPIDIEILRTAILLSAHQSRHLPAGADPLPVGVPSNVGVLNAEGVAELFARQDHVHNHPAGLGFDLHHDHYGRMLSNIFSGGWGYSPSAETYDIGAKMELVPLQVPFTITVDAIGFLVGVQAGNVRVGIYADNGDVPDGGALLVESAVTAVGAGNHKQEISIADTQLPPNLYWLAILGDDAAYTFAKATQVGSWATGYGGTFQPRGVDTPWGALPNPCPVSETLVERGVAQYVMIKSVP